MAKWWLPQAEKESELWTQDLLARQAQNAVTRAAYGLGPRRGAPGGLDPANAAIHHIVEPRDSEVAMILAEHARTAQRSALKALSLAAKDAARATEAASRANTAASEALSVPAASFPVYKERLLPGEPWFVGINNQDKPSPYGWLQARPPEGVNLEKLSEWFEKYPGPPKQDEGDSGDAKEVSLTKGPAPVPYLEVPENSLLGLNPMESEFEPTEANVSQMPQPISQVAVSETQTSTDQEAVPDLKDSTHKYLLGAPSTLLGLNTAERR